MNNIEIKQKLADAHNNFPMIDSHPAVLYAEALNTIVELESLNRKMHSAVSGYLDGDNWHHWQQYNQEGFTIDE